MDKLFDHLDTVSKWLAVIAIFLAFMWIIIPGLHKIFFEPKSHIVKPAIKSKMKYHGTDVLLEDWKGNMYFYRKGRRIRI